ncbi:hypothetical protein GF402_06850 [Candidatus Fermentibacteria bacterium]|nr:hypothetical protein [Candidatus Fermentibacteria bacterium]
MSVIRLLATVVGLLLFLAILKALIRSFTEGSSREEQYRKLQREERGSTRKSGSESPKCPICGEETEPHEYPHIKVYRCIRYPECRGFVKAPRSGRPKFALDWERKRRKDR